MYPSVAPSVKSSQRSLQPSKKGSAQSCVSRSTKASARVSQASTAPSMYSSYSHAISETFNVVDEKIQEMDKEKKHILAQLNVEKEVYIGKLKSTQGSAVSLVEIVDQVDENIQCVETQYVKKLQTIATKEMEVKGAFASVKFLGKSVAELEREIERIKHERDEVVDEISMKKKFIRDRLRSLENLDILLGEIGQRIRTHAHTFAEEMDELQRLKDAILARTDLTDEEKAEMIAKIDAQMKELKDAYAKEMGDLHGQKTILELHTKRHMANLDELADLLRRNFEEQLAELERQKIGATPSQIELINKKIAELKAQFERDMAQIEKYRGLIGEGSIIAFYDELGNLVFRRREDDVKMTLDDLSGTISQSCTYSGSESSSSSSETSHISFEDAEYLRNCLGHILTLALAEIVARQPTDPVHYLAHWLFKYRYTQDAFLIKKKELDELLEERFRIMEEIRKRQLELDAYKAVIDMIQFAEDEADRRAQEMAQLLMAAGEGEGELEK